MASFDDPVIVSSNRYYDIEPYGNQVYHSNVNLWGNIFPWEFPQNGLQHEEQAFLRGFFSDREVYTQGGQVAGFRFLKQVWYCLAEMNAFQRIPLVVRDWFESESNSAIVRDPEMTKWALSEDAVSETFFTPDQHAMYGIKFLSVAAGCIQQRLRHETAAAAPPVLPKDLANDHLKVPGATTPQPATTLTMMVPVTATNGSQYSSRSASAQSRTPHRPQLLGAQQCMEPQQVRSFSTTPSEKSVAGSQFSPPRPETKEGHDFQFVASGKYFPQGGEESNEHKKRWQADQRNISSRSLTPARPEYGVGVLPVQSGPQHHSLHPSNRPYSPYPHGSQPTGAQALITSDPSQSQMRVSHPGYSQHAHQQPRLPPFQASSHGHPFVPPTRSYPGQQSYAHPRHYPHPVPQHPQWMGMPSGDVRNMMPGQRILSNELHRPQEIYMLKRDVNPANEMSRGRDRYRAGPDAGRTKTARQSSQSGPSRAERPLHGHAQVYEPMQGLHSDPPFFPSRDPVAGFRPHGYHNENFHPGPMHQAQPQQHGSMAWSSPRLGNAHANPEGPTIPFHQMHGAAANFAMPLSSHTPSNESRSSLPNGPTAHSITQDCVHIKKLVVLNVSGAVADLDVDHYFEDIIGGVVFAAKKADFERYPAPQGFLRPRFVNFQSHLSVIKALRFAQEGRLPPFMDEQWRIEVPRIYWDTYQKSKHASIKSNTPTRPNGQQVVAPHTNSDATRTPGHAPYGRSHIDRSWSTLGDVRGRTDSVTATNTSKKSQKSNNKKYKSKKQGPASQAESVVSTRSQESASHSAKPIPRPSEDCKAQPNERALDTQTENQAGGNDEGPAKCEDTIAVSIETHFKESNNEQCLTRSSGAGQTEVENGHEHSFRGHSTTKTPEEKTATEVAPILVTDRCNPSVSPANSVRDAADGTLAASTENDAGHEPDSTSCNNNQDLDTSLTDHSHVDTSSPSSAKSSSDSRKMHVPLKANVAVSKSLAQGTPPRALPPAEQSPRIVSDTSTLVTTPTFHTAPSTPSTISHSEKAVNNKGQPTVSNTSNKQEGKTVKVESKKIDKSKGPAKTESLSMFSKKEKPGSKKKDRKIRKGDTIKGKPEGFRLSPESSKQEQGRDDTNSDSTFPITTIPVIATEDKSFQTIQTHDQLQETLPPTVVLETHNEEHSSGNTEPSPQDGTTMLTVSKNDNAPKVDPDPNYLTRPTNSPDGCEQPLVTTTDGTIAADITEQNTPALADSGAPSHESRPVIRNHIDHSQVHEDSDPGKSVLRIHNKKSKRRKAKAKKGSVGADEQVRHNGNSADGVQISPEDNLIRILLIDESSSGSSETTSVSHATSPSPKKKTSLVKPGEQPHLITQSSPRWKKPKNKRAASSASVTKQAKVGSDGSLLKDKVLFFVHTSSSSSETENTSAEDTPGEGEEDDADDEEEKEKKNDRVASEASRTIRWRGLRVIQLRDRIAGRVEEVDE